MSIHRLVCLSQKRPTVAASEVLSVCQDYPSRHWLSGVSGTALCFGDQFLLLLEGTAKSLDEISKRIQTETPEAGMEIRNRKLHGQRAFASLAMHDIYLDEVARRDSHSARLLQDSILDLLGTTPEEGQDPFARIANLVDGLGADHVAKPSVAA